VKAAVNDAKVFVENAWDWNVNRFEDKVAVSKDKLPLLPNSDRGAYRIWNVRDSRGRRLRLIPKSHALDNPQKETVEFPTGYYMAGYDPVSQQRILGIYPLPSDPQVFSIESTYATPRLEAEGDILQIPAQPVILYATAFAVRERGETGGTSAQEWTAFAQQALRDAISKDTVWNEDEFVWHQI
jgi:hypothetical protein